MTRFIIKRILLTLLVVLGAAILVFTIMYFVPGDPTTIMLGDHAEVWQYEALRERLGLNKPFLVRLGKFLYDTFIRFDLGTSLIRETSVWEELMQRVPRTLLLGCTSVLISTVIAIPLGVSAAIHQNKWQDKLCITITMVGSSIPGFWLALLLIILFSVRLKLLPSFGIGGIQYYILPVLASSLASIAGNARQTRSSMLEVIRADFITSARAKGVPERSVKYKHMLPNALIPVLTVLGGSFGRCIAGTIVIETVFSIPGVGTYMMNGVNSRDYPVVQGSVVFISTVISLVMLLTDLAYGFVDPRIKALYTQGSAKKRKKSKEASVNAD